MSHRRLKVAIVHDWLTVMGGAEQVVLRLHQLFPDAPIYTSVFDAEKMPAFRGLDVRTTWMQRWVPKSLRYRHVFWPVLRAFAFRHLDLSEFDLIISSSSAEAKSVRKARPEQKHLAYIHTPIRYYWSHYEEFRREFQFGTLTPLIRAVIPRMVRWMRTKDLESIPQIDKFIANSTTTQSRIRDYYQRESDVIHPPVRVESFTADPSNPRSGFILWGRHVPYKRFDLAIEAANRFGWPLKIIGEGPDTSRLKRLAGPTVQFLGRVSDAELVRQALTAEAFLFPNEEDFGMSAVEALAAGLPVIALARGGVLDIVQEGVTGVLFEQPTVGALGQAVARMAGYSFDASELRQQALRFAPNQFDQAMNRVVEEMYRLNVTKVPSD